MSSPFNPLTALQPDSKTPTVASTTPLPAPAPAVAAAPAAPTAASPITGSPGHPFLSPSGAGLAGLGAFAGLPGMGSIPALTSIAGGGGLGVMAGQGGMSGLSTTTQRGWVEAEKEVTGADLDDALRAVTDISRLLERAEGLFVGDVFGEERRDAVQLEYAQTLLALISLTSSYLVGALPVPLSAVAGFTTKAKADDKESQPAPPANAMPTLAELTAWIEARAQAQFARRESVRVAAKAVGDVLKGTAGAAGPAPNR